MGKRYTVSTHVRRSYLMLEVRSRGEAVFEASSLGLVKLDERRGQVSG